MIAITQVTIDSLNTAFGRAQLKDVITLRIILTVLMMRIMQIEQYEQILKRVWDSMPDGDQYSFEDFRKSFLKELNIQLVGDILNDDSI